MNILVKNQKKYLITVLILENIFLVILTNFYYQYQTYRDITQSNEGLAEACDELIVSKDNLISALEKMKEFSPSIRLENQKIYLNYGISRAGESGVALLFNNYQLTNKSCNSEWKPAIETFKLN